MSPQIENTGQLTASHYSVQWSLLGPIESIDMVERQEMLLRIVDQKPEFFRGKKVLVAGCSYGWEVASFHGFGAKVTGVDLYVEKAREFIRRKGITESEVTLLQQNIESLDLPTDEYEYVYCNGVLHYTQNSEAGLKNIARVLRPGGELLLALYGSGGWFWRAVHFSRLIAKMLTGLGLGVKTASAVISAIPGAQRHLVV